MDNNAQIKKEVNIITTTMHSR
uniref:Uncharacterized protein n=1 Tax=Arundo donax TaxID=35708 RepID=A0A0A9EWZ0_ARUDO